MEIERSNPPSFAGNNFETNENTNQRAMQEIIRYVDAKKELYTLTCIECEHKIFFYVRKISEIF